MQGRGVDVEIIEERGDSADGGNGISKDEGALRRVEKERSVEKEVLSKTVSKKG